MNPQVLLCSSRRGQNIVSMVNKTESFFRPLDNPSLASSLLPLSSHRPLRPVAFFQPPLSPSVKWVTSPFPLVNRCDGTGKKKTPLCTSALSSLFSAWVPFHLMSLDATAARAPHHPEPHPPLLLHYIYCKLKHKRGKRAYFRLTDPACSLIK